MSVVYPERHGGGAPPRGDKPGILAYFSAAMVPAKPISGGVVHELPEDLREALGRDPEALATWEDITPLARNEYICWIQSPKKPETRRKRIDWGCSSLREGKRRPCCWPGCPHRGVKADGASAKTPGKR